MAKKASIVTHIIDVTKLRDFVRRIIEVKDEQRLDNEKHADEIKKIIEEAESAGMQPKVLRRVVAEKLRVKKEMDMDVKERECLNDYRAGLGLHGTPLGDAATKREKKGGEGGNAKKFFGTETGGTA
ncbi:MAG TPA: GapR family DNA-binding domain-containing protein [Alphaproteobacteria bacterium]|nr:GapR family DNA-binding domain-containing protein [Alphaproteobacteria bacterium]